MTDNISVHDSARYDPPDSNPNDNHPEHLIHINIQGTVVVPVDAKDEEDADNMVDAKFMAEVFDTGNFTKIYIDDWEVEEIHRRGTRSL